MNEVAPKYMDIMENTVQTLAFDHVIESKAKMKAVLSLFLEEDSLPYDMVMATVNYMLLRW